MLLTSVTEKRQKAGHRRILLVTPRFPFPVIGGDKLRIYNIVKYLSNYYRFTLASLYSTKEEAGAAIEEGIFEEIYRVRQPKAASYCYTAGNLFRGRSLQSGYFYNPELKRLVESKLGSYDLVLAHLIRVSDYVMGAGVPSICEMTDAISMNYERAGQTKGRSLKKIIYGFEHKRCLESERMCLESFDGCVLVSQNDRQYLAGRYPQYSEKMHVIPNGVNVDDFECVRKSVTKGKIVFIGNMRTLQNADAAVFFAREILSSIRDKCPEATFWIIGADPGREVRCLSTLPGVVVTGRVNDIRAYAQDAQVSVCPVRIGAGIQNKVLESMAMGLPVVTTRVGAEGLLAQDGLHFRVADTPAEFFDAVMEVLANSSVAEVFSMNGKALVQKNYSWDGMLKSYRDLIESVLDRSEGCVA